GPGEPAGSPRPPSARPPPDLRSGDRPGNRYRSSHLRIGLGSRFAGARASPLLQLVEQTRLIRVFEQSGPTAECTLMAEAMILWPISSSFIPSRPLRILGVPSR